MSALLHYFMDGINWVGFYLYNAESKQLKLGPFQGLPACSSIPLGFGVCGTAAAEKRTLRIENIDEFKGHIACDSHSRSELVIPLISGVELIGVLDIDSPNVGHFTQEMQESLEAFVQLIVFEIFSVSAK